MPLTLKTFKIVSEPEWGPCLFNFQSHATYSQNLQNCLRTWMRATPFKLPEPCHLLSKPSKLSQNLNEGHAFSTSRAMPLTLKTFKIVSEPEWGPRLFNFQSHATYSQNLQNCLRTWMRAMPFQLPEPCHLLSKPNYGLSVLKTSKVSNNSPVITAQHGIS